MKKPTYPPEDELIEPFGGTPPGYPPEED